MTSTGCDFYLLIYFIFLVVIFFIFFFFQAEDGIRDYDVTGVQTCALPIWIDLLNQDKKHLKVKEVTNNLDEVNRVLRIDNMKITSAQLDFSRVVPIDADAENTHPKNIFRISNNQVLAYPVVESFGEGIFFSFNVELIN